jgi:hypothetical protein
MPRIHNALDGGHRFVGLGTALVAAQVQLHVGRFGVGALGARRGQRVPPVVVDVLDMVGVLRELIDQFVVETVRVITKFVLTF